MQFIGNLPNLFDVYVMIRTVSASGAATASYPDTPTVANVPGRYFGPKKSSSMDINAVADKNTISIMLDAARLQDTVIEIYKTRIVLERKTVGGRTINRNTAKAKQQFVVVQVYPNHGGDGTLEHYQLDLMSEPDDA